MAHPTIKLTLTEIQMFRHACLDDKGTEGFLSQGFHGKGFVDRMVAKGYVCRAESNWPALTELGLKIRRELIQSGDISE